MNSIGIIRRDRLIYIPLLRQLWKPGGRCICKHCGGREGYLDTMMLRQEGLSNDRKDYTVLVHMPEGHPFHDKKLAEGYDGKHYWRYWTKKYE